MAYCKTAGSLHSHRPLHWENTTEPGVEKDSSCPFLLWPVRIQERWVRYTRSRGQQRTIATQHT